MKSIPLSAFSTLFLVFSLESANARSPQKLQHHKPMSKAAASGGVEANASQDARSKDATGHAGWNGSYVGVNAGMGFGATTGTNVVIPFGSGAKAGE